MGNKVWKERTMRGNMRKGCREKQHEREKKRDIARKETTVKAV